MNQLTLNKIVVVKNALLNNSRIDCILIWGHGIRYLHDILQDIRRNKNFDILKIEKHKPRSMKSFVKEMYAYDYAPFWHLKSKTRYLLATPKEVCFIFFQNLYPCEDYLDEGAFRHKESMTLKRFKEVLRDKYNPYEDDTRTHNHVIHATDSEAQTEQILKYLGYKQGLDLFCPQKNFIKAPYYLNGYRKFILKQIDVADLYCRIATGSSWNEFTIKVSKIEDSPQYLGLVNDMEIYQDYLNLFLGGPLQEDYNLERYLQISKNFEYLKEPNETSFVLVEKSEAKYVILDGLHRSCAHIKNGNSTIKICQLIK